MGAAALSDDPLWIQILVNAPGKAPQGDPRAQAPALMLIPPGSVLAKPWPLLPFED